MKSLTRLTCALLLGLGAAVLTGCLGFKPATDSVRYFVLSPIPDGSVQPLAGPAVPLGIAPVEIPEYLRDNTLIQRRGDYEIVPSPDVLWGERLDKGIQRVLAADLALWLGGSPVFTSTWRSESIRYEVRVRFTRFETAQDGQALLLANWEIRSPRQGTVRSGSSRHISKVEGQTSDPAAMVAALSRTLGDFTKEIAQVIRSLPAEK